MTGAFILYIISFHMKSCIVFSPIILYSLCAASPLEDINIIGNQHTRIEIILREIQHPIPGKYDSTLALKDRNRIYNLGLFSTVEIKQVDSLYRVLLVETFRFYPIPLVDHNEAKGWSYGGGIAFLNFRGLNQKLIFGSQIGKENTYFLSFRDYTWSYLGMANYKRTTQFGDHSRRSSYNYSNSYSFLYEP